MTKEWRQGQKKEMERRTFSFFCCCFRIIWKSCGSEGRGVGRISWNQKCTWGGGRGGKHNDKKNDTHTKIPNTKNQKYGEKSFIPRTCKYWSYPGPGLHQHCYSHSHSHIERQSILPSTHPVPVSSRVSLGLHGRCFRLFWLSLNKWTTCWWMIASSAVSSFSLFTYLWFEENSFFSFMFRMSLFEKGII